MAALSTSTWSDPAATKHVLLIDAVSLDLVSHRRYYLEASSTSNCGDTFLSGTGCFVTGPDLLGHGNGRHSLDYTIAVLVEELGPLLTTAGGNDHPHHAVAGHSLGGNIASALFPFLKSTRLVQVVLVDPPHPKSIAYSRKLLGDEVRNPKTPEAYLQEWPLLEGKMRSLDS